MKSLIAAFVVLVMVFSSITVLAQESEADDRYTIQVVTSPDFPPYDYLLQEGFEGIDMDIWKAIAYVLDCNVNFNIMDFDSIINAVDSGKFDVGASGFTVREDRKQSINFSLPYSTAYQAIIVLKDGPLADATSFDQLKGNKVSVETGTTGDYFAEMDFGRENIVAVNSYTDVIENLKTKHTQIAIVDNLVALSYSYTDPQLKILDILLPSAVDEDYAFVFNKDNTELLGYTNKALTYLEQEGVIEAIHNYYENEIELSAEEPGYFTKYPEKISELKVIAQYVPGETKYRLEVATNPDFAPYEYLVSHQFEGIDMDIWKAIAKAIDADVSFNFMEFDSIIPAIQTNKFDVGASGFTVREDRKESVNFSNTYSTAYQSILLLKSSSLVNAKTVDDLKGYKAVVETGTTGYEAAVYNFGDDDTIPCNSYNEVILSLKSKHADFAVVDNLVADSYVYADSDLIKIDIPLPSTEIEEYGFVFNKSNTSLLGYTNRALAYLEEIGVMSDIFEYYASINYDPNYVGYFSTYPEALEAIQVIDHYIPGGGEDTGDDRNWFEWLWDEIVRNFVDKDRYQLVVTGLENTIYITLIGLVLGVIIGTLCALVRTFHDLRGRFKVINAVVKVYITCIRGTPVLVQLLIIYFIVFASSSLNSIIIAGIAFGINSGAYVAEIMRGGINAVPRGQLEAAESLGMTFNQAMIHVIIPQAIRGVLPALCNEGISLLKETSIAGYIGIVDITKAAMLIRAQTYSAFVPLIAVALIYLIIVLVLQSLVGRLERRLNDAYR